MLSVKNLTKIYQLGARGGFKAVNNVNFDMKEGEIISLIGESGSGKTTIGKMILKLSSVTSGSIEYKGTDVTDIKNQKDLKAYYREVQGVFQDPFSTFNPIFKADRIFKIAKREFFSEIGDEEWKKKVSDAIHSVGLNEGDVLNKFSFQLSGGQLQRLLIARALLLNVKLLVADEIISMLDASTRIDVLNLLGELRNKGLSVIFVTHDLSLGYYISDNVVILYKGVMVEKGNTKKVFANPTHPYTRNLLMAVPRLDTKWKDMPELPPVDPNLVMYNPDIHTSEPRLREIEKDHWVAVE